MYIHFNVGGNSSDGEFSSSGAATTLRFGQYRWENQSL